MHSHAIVLDFIIYKKNVISNPTVLECLAAQGLRKYFTNKSVCSLLSMYDILQGLCGKSSSKVLTLRS